MADFHRREHQRRSKLGTLFYVKDHEVRRNRWPTRSPRATSTDPFLSLYPELRRATQYPSVRFINPNARCPVCREPVYYYQNEHGSRVFFDSIGPPWPKHPCTDNGATVCARDGSGTTLPWPKARPHAEAAAAAKWLSDAAINSLGYVSKAHGIQPLARITKRFKSGARVFLVLEMLGSDRLKSVYVACDSLSKCCQKDYCLALDKKSISYFCTTRMEPRDAKIIRFRNAAEFIDAMISAEQPAA